MNNSIIYAVLLTIGGLLFCAGGAFTFYLLWRWVRAIEESARRTCAAIASIDTAITDARVEFKAQATAGCAGLARVCELLAPASAELQANMAAVPKMLEGITKIATAQIEIMQAQRAAATLQQQNPFGRHNGPIPPRDTEAANLEHQVQQMMRAEGIGREEALLRMNPANAGSVWGDNVFDGWAGGNR